MMMNNIEDCFEDKHPFDLYSTGCYLSPMQIQLTNKEWRWIWVVNSFDSDSYYQGEHIELNPVADTQKELIDEPEPEPEIEFDDDEFYDDEEEE